MSAITFPKTESVRMETYGVNVDDTQIALVILANIKIAAREDYGHKFRPALQVIRK